MKVDSLPNIVHVPLVHHRGKWWTAFIVGPDEIGQYYFFTKYGKAGRSGATSPVKSHKYLSDAVRWLQAKLKEKIAHKYESSVSTVEFNVPYKALGYTASDITHFLKHRFDTIKSVTFADTPGGHTDSSPGTTEPPPPFTGGGSKKSSDLSSDLAQILSERKKNARFKI
jgi:hypothetical protein